MQQASHRGHRDAIDSDRRGPKPFHFCHHPEGCLKRLVGATLLATLIGLLFTVLFIPDALS
jgi:hypothetical protein